MLARGAMLMLLWPANNLDYQVQVSETFMPIWPHPLMSPCERPSGDRSPVQCHTVGLVLLYAIEMITFAVVAALNIHLILHLHM